MLDEIPLAELLRVCLEEPTAEAWQALVRRIHPVITASVTRITRLHGSWSPAVIEDLTQEVYLRLCQGRCRLLREFQSETPEALFSFLKVVASNVARDRSRADLAQKSGKGKISSLPERAAEVISAPGAGGQEIEQSLLLSHIDSVLSNLAGETAPRDKTIFWLYYRQGWSSKDIAGIKSLALTAKGVESVLQRLTRLLRSELASHPEPKGFHPEKTFSGRA